MALPTKDDIKTLDYAQWAQPFCYVEAKQLNTESLDYAQWAQPFYAALGESVTPPSYNTAQFMIMFGY